MLVVLDLDDVLANLRESLQQVLSRHTGINLHWHNWEHYDLRRHFLLESPELDQLLRQEQALENCEPEPGAAAATHELAALGYRIRVVTARGWHTEAAEISRQWLQQQGMYFDELDVVPLGGDKLQVLGEENDIRLAVDDHPSHLHRYSEAGIPHLVMDRPWNRHFRGERIYSMAEAVDWLQTPPLS